MTLNLTSKTVQDVANTVRRQFGDESGVQITDSDIFRWVNDGQKEIIVKNKVLKGRASINAVSGQENYTLPEANIAAIESIHWNGTPIRGVPYAEVEAYVFSSPVDTLQTGTPQIWYEWGGTVSFWPKPQGVVGNDITLLYSKNPDNVDSMGDSLSVPDKYFNTLIKYVLAQAHEMDEDWEASNFKATQFTGDLDQMADDERTTSGMTYPVILDVVDY